MSDREPTPREPSGVDADALTTSQLDADLYAAALAAVGDAIARAEAAGRCCHQAWTGDLLGPQRCRSGFGKVFRDPAELTAAQDEAVSPASRPSRR